MPEQQQLKRLVNNTATGQTLFVMAGGPSIEQFDLSALSQLQDNILVCNTLFRLFPKALIAHHSDYNWWQQFGNELLTTYQGKLICTPGLGTNVNHYPKMVQKLNYVHSDFSADINTVMGINSGLQALYLAHYFQPKTIVLLGFDLCRGQAGQSHWSNAQSLAEEGTIDSFMFRAIERFKQFAEKRQQWWHDANYQTALPEIINLSAISKIDCFDKDDDLQRYIELARQA